MSHLSILH
jgi:hypothetical protein